MGITGIIGNMIRGSTSAGVITAASLVAPVLQILALSPQAAVLAGARGSVIVRYVNSSYFRVCTSLSKLSFNGAIRGYEAATLVGGVVALLPPVSCRLRD